MNRNVKGLSKRVTENNSKKFQIYWAFLFIFYLIIIFYLFFGPFKQELTHLIIALILLMVVQTSILYFESSEERYHLVSMIILVLTILYIFWFFTSLEIVLNMVIAIAAISGPILAYALSISYQKNRLQKENEYRVREWYRSLYIEITEIENIISKETYRDRKYVSEKKYETLKELWKIKPVSADKDISDILLELIIYVHTTYPRLDEEIIYGLDVEEYEKLRINLVEILEEIDPVIDHKVERSTLSDFKKRTI